MPACVGCSTETNMERVANDIPESEGKHRALNSVYLPLCVPCSKEADEHQSARDANRPRAFGGSPSGRQETSPSAGGQPDSRGRTDKT